MCIGPVGPVAAAVANKVIWIRWIIIDNDNDNSIIVINFIGSNHVISNDIDSNIVNDNSNDNIDPNVNDNGSY